MKFDLILNIIITFIIGVLNFIINKIFSQYLGSELLGIMRLFTQIVSFLNLAELGVSVSASYALYSPLIKGEYSRVKIIMYTLNTIYKKISLFIVLSGILFNIFLPLFFGEKIFQGHVYIYWNLYVANASISYFYARYVTLFNADQKYRVVRKIQGFSKIITSFLQIVSLIAFHSFILFIFLFFLENLINYYYYHKYYNKNYSYLKGINIEKKVETKLFKDMKNLFWHKIASVLINNTDYIIISKWLSMIMVAIYSSYLMVNQMLLMIFGLLIPVIRPRIGKYIAKNTKYNIYLYWKRIYVVHMFFLSIIFTGAFYLYVPFINLWMGKNYLLPQSTILLLLINLILTVIKRVMEVFKFSSGFFEDIYFPIIETGINLFLSLVLVKKIGLNGVIIGTVVSNFIVSDFFKTIAVYKRCFDMNFLKYFQDSVYYKILLVLSFYSSSFMINNFVITKYSKWGDFLITGGNIFLVIVIFTSFIFLLDRTFRMYFIELKNAILRRK